MKKLFTLSLLVCMAMSAAAQLASGFYRIQNVSTGRYIVMYDPYVLVNKATGTVNLTSLQTITSFKTVRSHMGSVWYMEDKGNSQYDLFCQHSSLGVNSEGFYPKLWAIDGSYRIYGEYDGFTKYLTDANNEDTGEGNVSINGNKLNWTFLPIGGDNYIGIEPEVNADGYYWATFLSGFPFTLGSGMKAYYINNVNDNGFSKKEISGEIPAKMPVLIRLNGGSASDNIITVKKTSSASVPSDNKMYGVWYSSDLGGKHENWNVKYESNNRILGKADGHLAFVKASSSDLIYDTYIEHNRGYLAVGANASSNIVDATSGIASVKDEATDESKKGIFTLTGQKIPEGTTPRPGIYIKDGKKIVIK